MQQGVSKSAFTAAMAFAAVGSAANATFYPTINIPDTDGNLVQARGGAILKSANSDDPSFFWFGEDKAGETDSGHFIGANCYEFADFASWEPVGHVLKPISGTDIDSESIVERPKDIYNDKNDEYSEFQSTPDQAEASIALPSGCYTASRSSRPAF